MKKRWIVGLILLGVLAAGITTGGALAQVDAGGDTSSTDFAGRVATILGLQEAEVKDAFQQAVRQQKDEAYKQRLDSMVSRGLLTEEEAAEGFAWFQSRPDSPARRIWGQGQGRRGFGQGAFRRGGRLGKAFGPNFGPHGPGGLGFHRGFGRFDRPTDHGVVPDQVVPNDQG